MKRGRAVFVFGFRCGWWDSPDQAGAMSGSVALPCCPHCGSPLLQMDEAEWWRSVDKFEANGHAGYRRFIEWVRGQCFGSADREERRLALACYEHKTGATVEGLT